MSKLVGCIIVIVLFGAILYVAGLTYPFDIEDEGPWPENYR